MPKKPPKQLVVQAAVDAIEDDAAAVSGSGTAAHLSAPAPIAPAGHGSGAASSSGGAHLLSGIGPSQGIASSAVTQRPKHTGKK